MHDEDMKFIIVNCFLTEKAILLFKECLDHSALDDDNNRFAVLLNRLESSCEHEEVHSVVAATVHHAVRMLDFCDMWRQDSQRGIDWFAQRFELFDDER